MRSILNCLLSVRLSDCFNLRIQPLRRGYLAPFVGLARPPTLLLYVINTF